MSRTRFDPFNQYLDQAKSLELLQDVSVGAEDSELFLERLSGESLVFDDGRLRNAGYTARQGFGLRTVLGDATGYAHSTEISEPALRRAAAAARLAVTNGGGQLAGAAPMSPLRLYEPIDPSCGISLSQRIELLREIDSYLRACDPRVVQVSVSLASSLQEVFILRPEGTLASDIRPMSRLSISVIVENNDRRESGNAGGGGRETLHKVIAPEYWRGCADDALRMALVNLRSVAAPAGVMDVVLGPGWPGILLHEAVGHGLEGDFNRKKASAFSGLMGQRVAASGVTVVDDGTIENSRGSINIDDEGTPPARNVLIDDGILVGYMQDRKSARQMGEQPTGNGRRESFAHAPMPRMTNTYMPGGKADPSEILAGLKDGIYAVGFGGGQVDITNGKFVFSCTEAYRVRNGVVGDSIRGATLIGDGATALQKVREIGNDMALGPGIGTCGKQGQWVAVGIGQPTVMIGGLTIGGAQG